MLGTVALPVFSQLFLSLFGTLSHSNLCLHCSLWDDLSLTKSKYSQLLHPSSAACSTAGLCCFPQHFKECSRLRSVFLSAARQAVKTSLWAVILTLRNSVFIHPSIFHSSPKKLLPTSLYLS